MVTFCYGSIFAWIGSDEMSYSCVWCKYVFSLLYSKAFLPETRTHLLLHRTDMSQILNVYWIIHQFKLPFFNSAYSYQSLIYMYIYFIFKLWSDTKQSTAKIFTNCWTSKRSEFRFRISATRIIPSLAADA